MLVEAKSRQADILELKNRISMEPGLSGRLLLSMSADALLHGALKGAQESAYSDAEGITTRLSAKAITAESYHDEVLALAELWEGPFTEAICLPGTHWPKNMHDPALFMGYLRRLDLLETEVA